VTSLNLSASCPTGRRTYSSSIGARPLATATCRSSSHRHHPPRARGFGRMEYIGALFFSSCASSESPPFRPVHSRFHRVGARALRLLIFLFFHARAFYFPPGLLTGVQISVMIPRACPRVGRAGAHISVCGYKWDHSFWVLPELLLREGIAQRFVRLDRIILGCESGPLFLKNRFARFAERFCALPPSGL